MSFAGRCITVLTLALVSTACSDRALDNQAPSASGGGGGMPASPSPVAEQCNGIDDDLDGRVDEGCPIRLTRDAADDFNPEIKGNRVAWIRGGALYLKELPDGLERQIVDGVAPSFAFDGQHVVTLADSHFVVIDVDTQEETVIMPVDLDGELGAPSFAGHRVVWQQHIPRSWAWDESEDIYAYDLETRTLTAVTQSHVMRTDALGDGAQVVWGDGARFHDWINYNSYYDLYVADLSQGGMGGRAIAVGADALSTVPVALRKGRVLAYEEQLYGGQNGGSIAGTHTCQLVLYDVAGGQRSALEPLQLVDGTACDATQPGFSHQLTFDSDKPEAFDGDRVVRELHPLDESDLYLYEVASGAQVRLTNHPRRSQHPRLDGNLLVWQDDRNDQLDLYLMDLSDVAAGDVFPQGNPRNGDCEGGDRGGCVARVGRAWGTPALAVVGDRVVYSGHDGISRFDVTSRQLQTLVPVLDPAFTQRHQPQYVEVVADGDSLAYIRSDQTADSSFRELLYVQRQAGGEPLLLETGGYALAASQGRVAWLVHDATTTTTSLATSDRPGTPTLLTKDPTVSISHLALSADWAVYTQTTQSDPAPPQLTVVALNLRTAEVRRPADGLPAGGQDDQPAIDGDTIVWSHVAAPTSYGAVQARVYAYDLTSGTRTALSSATAQATSALAVSGAHVCWDDAAGVWLYNLATGQLKRMSSRGRGCAVSDSVIAFYEGSDVYERRLEGDDP